MKRLIKILVEDKDYITKTLNIHINITQIKETNLQISKYWINTHPQKIVSKCKYLNVILVDVSLRMISKNNKYKLFYIVLLDNTEHGEQDVSGSFTSDEIDRQDIFGVRPI